MAAWAMVFSNWETTVEAKKAVPRLTIIHGMRLRMARGRGLKISASPLTWARR